VGSAPASGRCHEVQGGNTGNQGWNHEGTKTACEIVCCGEIGEVKEVHAWTGGIYGGQSNIPATGPEAKAVPSTLDWNLWTACAEPRPTDRSGPCDRRSSRRAFELAVG